MFNSAFKEFSNSTFHLKIPVDKQIPREKWINLSFDIASFCESINMTFGVITSITVKGACHLRKIFTLRRSICEFDPHLMDDQI